MTAATVLPPGPVGLLKDVAAPTVTVLSQPTAWALASSTDPFAPLPLRRTVIDYTPFVVSSRYTHLALIARGSGTTLVSATDVGRGGGGGGGGPPPHARRVAIKKVPDVGASAAITRQVLREVRILRAVSHPHLLRLLDVAAARSDGGVGKGVDVYLVTPLAAGGDLGSVLADAAAGRRPPLGDATTRRVVGQTLAALAALHATGIVHRDVKPDNIFLTGGGGDGVGDVLLGDFGLSRYIAPRRPRASRGGRGGGGAGDGAALTAGSAARGPSVGGSSSSGVSAVTSADDAGLTQGVATRGYRAPELIAPRRRRPPTYDASMDLWAVGVVLAQALLPGAKLPARATAWSARPGGGSGGGGRGRGRVRLEPPPAAGKEELGAQLWAEITALHPELEAEPPLLGGGKEEKKRRRGLVALLRRR